MDLARRQFTTAWFGQSRAGSELVDGGGPHVSLTVPVAAKAKRVGQESPTHTANVDTSDSRAHGCRCNTRSYALLGVFLLAVEFFFDEALVALV